MANSYCNDTCKACGEIVLEGKAFIVQPATLTKEGYGHYRDKGPIKDGRLRIKYHGGGTGHRMVFHIKCWETMVTILQREGFF